jgi:preprotein translocase subunit Sss1
VSEDYWQKKHQREELYVDLFMAAQGILAVGIVALAIWLIWRFLT